MGDLLAEENLPQAGTAESSGSLSWEIAPDKSRLSFRASPLSPLFPILGSPGDFFAQPVLLNWPGAALMCVCAEVRG